MLRNYMSIAKDWVDLVCPVERYKSTSKKRLELVCFYQSALVQAIYSQRRISIEPLIERIKCVFRIDPLSTWISACICNCIIIGLALSDNIVYYNYKTEKINPRSIKYMLGTW